MRRSPRNTLLDAEQHRRNASAFAVRAASTTSVDEQDHFARMARTSELLAKNADWLKSIDGFLADWRPKPTTARSPG
ncbi:hypothetical protein GJ689_20970 [Rhodoplanes serenus]|jgi:hypothetical protein|uniref:Uncharacterized protein n=1 Tax=Rhodoplanes serenus TaxID=200615 RepID=A0A327KCA6_9BRAD|nr:hypothetical protein [Rhodoplanes serenus]MTW18677.1 hypothetical protein [Rhodoplanes serenus]RAI32928.1 hypothetical protein CH340_13885 [Rhodoplanes serenus]VCU07433.1 hypothetical protein RHODGE_RHODGE_00529 [Rhodoplanes serenus]